MIIVGIDNTGAVRIDEYTPTHDAARNGGGRAEDYGRMLIEELKPIIDATYRTLPELEHRPRRLVARRSGLAAPRAHASRRLRPARGDVALGVVAQPRDSRRRRSFASPQRPRIWLDIGGREGVEGVNDARSLRDLLRRKGWRDDADFNYFEDRRADHSERAWAKRAPAVLEFLFPPPELSALNGS